VVDLPSGERLAASRDRKEVSGNCIHPSFRVIALGLPASTGGSAGVSVADSRLRYITSDLGWTYHFLAEASPNEILNLLKQHVSKQSSQMKALSIDQKQFGVSQLNDVLAKLSQSAGIILFSNGSVLYPINSQSF
jgi:hypothetical protein